MQDNHISNSSLSKKQHGTLLARVQQKEVKYIASYRVVMQENDHSPLV
ncbi:hypothetical protein A1O9_09738 [Acetobacter orientalis]|uniref:Uncharacterized protein n=1 Tax=Acetobacter orientalis TaxID=146474 RepID=A0A2Z5ZET1_9PROT|nr:hypothetical protein A1O9_09738 [Acetobacter orientalis]